MRPKSVAVPTSVSRANVGSQTSAVPAAWGHCFAGPALSAHTMKRSFGPASLAVSRLARGLGLSARELTASRGAFRLGTEP